MVATWARVLTPWGFKRPSMPLMTPCITIQLMASVAHGDTSPASGKSSRKLHSPVKPLPRVLA